MRRFRDVITGRFDTRSHADAHPDTTVSETVHSRPSVAAVGMRLASYADRGAGTDQPQAYEADPDFWNTEATRFLDWTRG